MNNARDDGKSSHVENLDRSAYLFNNDIVLDRAIPARGAVRLKEKHRA